MKEPYKINPNSGECTLTKMSKEPDHVPTGHGSWGIGVYSTSKDFNGECDGYGFARPHNPNHFFPDYESCEPWEIANHKEACRLYNLGQWEEN